MQDPEVLIDMTRDYIQYVMVPQIRHDSESGDYVGYDIAAYDSGKRDFVGMVCDVTLDREQALYMVEMFNRHQLSPIHLKEVILNFLE